MMAEPLVLLPGMMCDVRLFGPQITDLSRDTAVMAAPITIGERIEEIASNLLSLLPTKFALLGHGMGGIVAIELIRRAPDRVTRIALMNTTPLAEAPHEAAAREPMIIGAKAGRLSEIMRSEVPPGALAPGPQRVEVLSALMQMAMDLGPEVYVRQSRALQRRRDQQSSLRRIKVPALVLCGQYDTLCPVKRHTFMAELIPHAELAVLDDAGHLPTIEAPDETTAALRAWMTQPYVLR